MCSSPQYCVLHNNIAIKLSSVHSDPSLTEFGFNLTIGQHRPISNCPAVRLQGPRSLSSSCPASISSFISILYAINTPRSLSKGPSSIMPKSPVVVSPSAKNDKHDETLCRKRKNAEAQVCVVFLIASYILDFHPRQPSGSDAPITSIPSKRLSIT